MEEKKQLYLLVSFCLSAWTLTFSETPQSPQWGRGPPQPLTPSVGGDQQAISWASKWCTLVLRQGDAATRERLLDGLKTTLRKLRPILFAQMLKIEAFFLVVLNQG